MDIYTVPNVKQIASGKQPHSTGRSARCFVTTYRGGMGRVGGREMQEGRDMGSYCMCLTDLLCYKAEANTSL